MNIKEYNRKAKKKRPKLYAKLEAEWDYKMIGPVLDFVMDLEKHVNPVAKKAVPKGTWLYDGPKIEADLWKVLRKVRRITLLEK